MLSVSDAVGPLADAVESVSTAAARQGCCNTMSKKRTTANAPHHPERLYVRLWRQYIV
jgi:hypothetical protein